MIPPISQLHLPKNREDHEPSGCANVGNTGGAADGQGHDEDESRGPASAGRRWREPVERTFA
jgi:hypothetical protein